MTHDCYLLKNQRKSFSVCLVSKNRRENATCAVKVLLDIKIFVFLYFQHQPDLAIGVHLMDRYTFYLLEFLEDIHPASKANMNDLVRKFMLFNQC